MGRAEGSTEVVVLGGTSFMGRHVLAMLAADDWGAFVLNRGTKYWGDNNDMGGTGHEGVTPIPTANVSETVMQAPHTHIPMDRDDHDSVMAAFAALQYLLKGRAFTIVDFSCDDEVYMQTVWKALVAAGLLPARYVLISTDSVYTGVGLGQRPTGGIMEDAQCVPQSRRGYGGEKLRGELELKGCVARYSPQTIPYILRLPDVIGPCDNTGRYWAMLLWARSGVPMLLTRQAAGERLSLVYGPDVSRLCIRIASERGTMLPGGTYNLACTEVITVKDLVADTAGREELTAIVRVFDTIAGDSDTSSSSEDEAEVSCDYYPSVSCGPISVASATTSLGWSPTPLREALEATHNFFHRREPSGREHERALKKLPLLVRMSLRAR